MLFARSESVKHCGAIAVCHLLQRPFHEANASNTKNGNPVKNGGPWSIWDDHLVSSGYLLRVTISLRSLYQIFSSAQLLRPTYLSQQRRVSWVGAQRLKHRIMR
jgi:hypothetical protein